MKKSKLVVIAGTTASGKSSLGIDLAQDFNAEIISADSRQVYKYLDLGTGKVTPEEMSLVKHHLIDILPLNAKFSVADFQNLAYTAIDNIIARQKKAFLVGGTGLYVRAIAEGYDLENTIEPNEELRKQLEEYTLEELKKILQDKYGIKADNESLSKRHLIRNIEKAESGKSQSVNLAKYDVLMLGLTFERAELYSRIGQRLDMRIKDGMIEEVENLIKLGATPEFLYALGLEYRHIYMYISGKYKSFDEFKESLFKEIRHFAKRQMTWFKKEKNIVWLDTQKDYTGQARELITKFYEN